MRERKFRAFDTERKMYVPQGEIIFFNYGETRLEVNPNCLEYAYKTINQKNFIVEDWIGLKDRDGNDVYEGDILVSVDGRRFLIKYVDKVLQFKMSKLPAKEGWNKIHELSAFKQLKELKIIGNIHENPELL